MLVFIRQYKFFYNTECVICFRFLRLIYYKYSYVCCFLLLMKSFWLDTLYFDNLHTIELNLFTSIIFCLFVMSQLCDQFSPALLATHFYDSKMYTDIHSTYIHTYFVYMYICIFYIGVFCQRLLHIFFSQTSGLWLKGVPH